MSEVSLSLWDFGQHAWLQDRQNQSFTLARIGDADVPADCATQAILDVVVGARTHPATGNSPQCAKNFLPAQFNHCPFCGSSLPAASAEEECWVPPFGAGNGLRVTRRSEGVGCRPVEPARSFPLPRLQGDFQFIVGQLGTSLPVLVGFDRISGRVSVFSPGRSQWATLKAAEGGTIGENRLPGWSWSAGVITEAAVAGFAVPTAKAPVWVMLDWSKGSVSSILGDGECIGGVGVLGKRAFVPTRNSGKIAIQCFDADKGQWSSAATLATSLPQEDDSTSIYSVPIIDEGRQCLFWVSAEGLLQFNVANGIVSWRPWETDPYPCRAMPELGPPYRDQLGNYWQICFDDHDDGYRYYKLSGDESDVQHVDGGRFSSGISSFSKQFDYWGRPWDRRDELRDQKAEFFRAPLLCLDEGTQATLVSCFDRGASKPLLQVVGERHISHVALLRVEYPDDVPLDLPMEGTLNISCPWELRVFVYRGCLVMYVPDEGVCLSWRLR